jgi:hypothetical protein
VLTCSSERKTGKAGGKLPTSDNVPKSQLDQGNNKEKIVTSRQKDDQKKIYLKSDKNSK